jgi:hypothetical protein
MEKFSFSLLQKEKKLFYALIPLDIGATARHVHSQDLFLPRPEELKSSPNSLSGIFHTHNSSPNDLP